MAFWIGLVAFLIGCVILQYFVQEKYQHIIPKVMIIVLTFFSAFRYGLAADYFPYVTLFETVTWTSQIEPSFRLIIILLRNIGCDYQMMFFIYAVLTSMFLWKGFRYYLKDWQQMVFAIAFYGIMLDGYWNSLSIIRQYLSIAIFIWGSKYILEKNFIKYSLICLLMASLHYSSIILVICYSINYIRFNKKFVVLGAMIGVGIAYLNIVPDVVENLVDFFDITRYKSYVNFKTIPFGSGLSYLFYIVLWLFVIFNLKMDNYRSLFVSKLYTLYLYTLFLFSFSDAICRIRHYFVLFGVISVILTVWDKRNQLKNTILIMVCIIYSALLLNIFYKDFEKMENNFTYVNSVKYQMRFNLIK